MSGHPRDKYTYRVTWSDEDSAYVGLCTEFPSLSWLAATRDEALHGIEALVRDAVADMRRRGETLPEPISAHDFSGTFKVRIPAPTRSGAAETILRQRYGLPNLDPKRQIFASTVPASDAGGRCSGVVAPGGVS
jgi:predicted RNase H-like HicB family nuclease